MKLFKIWAEDSEPLESIERSAQVASESAQENPSHSTALAELDKLEIGETYFVPWGAEMTRIG